MPPEPEKPEVQKEPLPPHDKKPEVQEKSMDKKLSLENKAIQDTPKEK